MLCDGRESGGNVLDSGWQWRGPGPAPVGIRQQTMTYLQERCDPSDPLTKLFERCMFVTEWLPFGSPKGGKVGLKNATAAERLRKGLVAPMQLAHLRTTRVFRCTLGGAPIAQLHAAIADASEEERAADEAALRAQLGDGGSAGGDETTAGDGTMVSSATGAASMNGGGARRRARRRERRRALHQLKEG